MKVLLISGSPRNGNTEMILNKIQESLSGIESKLILLREKNIDHCRGCLFCDKTKKCAISDDMDNIRNEMLWADVIIIGTPNYYDNVPGLLKDFIDRTNPFYETGLLKGKKMINIVTGGGNKGDTGKVAEGPLADFGKAHDLDIVGNFIFEGLNVGEVLNDEDFNQNIEEVIRMIKSL